jgi:hypothetical protein
MDGVSGTVPGLSLGLPRTGLLVLAAPAVQGSPASLVEIDPDVIVHPLTGRVPRRQEYDTVVLLAHDLIDLRAAATGLGQVGSAVTVAVVFERQTAAVPSVVWRPGWPTLDDARAVLRPRPHVVLRFGEPAPVRAVVAALARAGSPSGSPSSAWPVIGVRRDDPERWPPDDPAAVVSGRRRLFEAAGDFPPDLVLAEDAPAETVSQAHPVLGRAPVVVRAEPELTWAQMSGLDEAGRAQALTRRGSSSLGPVDEHLLNPMGFDREPVGPALRLRSRPDGTLVAGPDGGEEIVVARESGRVSDGDVPALRRLPGLHVDWLGARGPQAYCRALTRLACIGVPLVTDTAPTWVTTLLARDLVEALRRTTDLGDALQREEHSIRLRRAALTHYAASAWRRSLTLDLDVQSTPPETVSVLLVTRRPEQLEFALGQVARQRGVDVELVLATHGFSPDPGALARFATRSDAPVTVVDVGAETLFGEVLNRAAGRAQGSLVAKMDDDDWYGPDFLRDLVLARRYSGAGLVGVLPELTYLQQLDTTTRRAGPTEVYSSFVAGGSMLVDTAALRSVGGFRATRKYVDAALLRGMSSAGVPIYRTHGLGYVLRRGSHGHTWDPGLDYFLHPDRMAERWPGFRPSALLESRAVDLPPGAGPPPEGRTPG